MALGGALKSVFTRFTFDIDKGKLAAVNRTTGQAVTNLSMAARQTAALKARVGSMLGTLGGFLGVAVGGAAVKSLTVDFARGADEIGRMSEALGVSTDFFQGFREALKTINIAGDETSQIIADISERMFDAAHGSKALADDFGQIGLTVPQLKELAKAGPEKQVLALADAMQKAGPGAKRTFAAMSGLGDVGARMLPLFKHGSEGLKRMIADAKRFGVVLSKEAIESAREFNKRMIVMKARLRGIRNAMAVRLMPVISKLIDWFVKLSQNVVVAKVALVAVTAAAAVATVIIGNIVRGFVLAQWAAFVSIIKAAVMALHQMNFAMASVALKVLAFAAVLALIPLLIEDLMVFARGGDSVVERILGRDSDIVEAMEELRGTFSEIAGTLSKSFEALWVSIVKLASMFGIKLTTVKALLKTVGKFLFKSVLRVLLFIAMAVGFVATGFAAVLSIITDVATAIVDWLRPAVITVADAIDAMMNKLQPVFDWIGKTGRSIGKSIGAAFAKAAEVAKRAWRGLGTLLSKLKKKAIGLGGRLKEFVTGKTEPLFTGVTPPGATPGAPAGGRAPVVVTVNTTVNANGLDEPAAKRVAKGAAKEAVREAANGLMRDLTGVPVAAPGGIL